MSDTFADIGAELIQGQMRQKDERIAELEAQLAAAEEKEIATWQTNQAQGRHIDTLHAELGAEREKVRVLRVALRKITEANEPSPVKTYQRMEQIAHQALRATAPEQEGK